MANLHFSPEELAPLIRQIVAVVLNESEQIKRLLNGKLALPEPEAAALIGLNTWQLRDLRLAGRISYSRIVGGRIRYTLEDLLTYLSRTREEGKSTRR